MKFLNLVKVIALIFFIPSFSIAQKPRLVFHQLSTKDGLSENTVRSIIEDKKGFMWFGTEDGANRYDGYEFKIYRNNPGDPYSISNTNTKYLYIDKSGRLWAGTVGGMNIYDPKTDRFYNYKSNHYPALKSLKGHMEMISQDSKNNYWVISSSDGLYKISDLAKEAEKFKPPFQGNSSILSSMAIYDDQTIYVGTIDGVLKFNTATATFEDLGNKYGKGYQVNKVHIDKKRNIWLCTTNGLKIIFSDGTFKEYYPVAGDNYSMMGKNVVDIVAYKDGNYLLAVDGSGIEYFDVASEKFYHYTYDNESQLSGNNIADLYLDLKGDLWVGTFLNGINFSNSTTNLFVLVKNATGSDERVTKGIVSSFHRDKNGNFWIGTDGGGVFKKEKNKDTYINYHASGKPNSLINNAIISIAEASDGIMYFSSYGGGLSEYDPLKNHFKVFMPNVNDPTSISNDKTKDIEIYRDEVWVCGFGKGISVMDRKTKKFRHYKSNPDIKTAIPSDWVQSMYVDKKGVLWLATLNGLSKYIPEKDHFKNYFFGDSLRPNANLIIDLIEDGFGNFWVGTLSDGIMSFNPDDGSFQNYSTKDGLTDNNIKSILNDNYGNVWITGNNGITKLHVPSLKFKSYTFKDGVPSCAFFLNSKFKDSEGSVYFGTNNGYMIINPSMTVPNKNIPLTVITKMKIFNEVILPGSPNSPLKASIIETSEITLNHNQNSISFEFAALNFNNSQNNQYAYILEGFDQKWVQASHRDATYTNLNPGTYTFKVIASNNDNVWNNKGTTIVIHITPPFYKTWWFELLFVVGVLASLYAIYAWRLKTIKRKTLELESLVRERTQELSLKTQELKESNEQLEGFVYKASHDIKGPLKSIMGLTTVGQKDVKDEAARSYFDHILKSTKKLDNLLMDLLEMTRVKQATIKLEEINFREIVSEAMLSFANLPEYQSMKFYIDIKQDGAGFLSDKKLLYSLIQNLVENPIKYRDPSKAENILHIDITVTNTSASLRFKDNGIGIPSDACDKVFDMFFKVNEKSDGAGLGLYIVKATVDKLKGTIKVESKEGEGSIFIVNL